MQKIENELGRKRVIEKGPRSIDLDIVLYDSQKIADERLKIPHPLMLEREFVLRPLADLIPDQRLPAPNNQETIVEHLAALNMSEKRQGSLRVTNLAPNLAPIKTNDPSRRTLIMAVMNVTPDSFSDGGLHEAADVSALASIIRKVKSDGAAIIDIGGQSTRPGAERISPDEELNRVLPVIQLIRSMRESSRIVISVDTFHSTVAEAALAAGADIINDVSAGMLDPEMLRILAKHGKTVVLMHMRGDPSSMTRLTSYPRGIIEGVGGELVNCVESAVKAGIPRWRIVLDPGIGFAKTMSQNLELLRRFEDLREYPGLRGFPWLVGASRKGFIGKITGVEKASQRGWGTAATVTASVRGGADIVRVHDVPEMRSVVQMADAIFRV